MRAFISINLNSQIQEGILKFQQSQHGVIHNVRWTKPENCHLTLKFLGDISAEQADKLTTILHPVAEQFSPFQFELAGVGSFPHRGPLSVLWIGVKKGNSGLIALEESIRAAMAAAKIKFDKKKFHPHLTIGRSKKNKKVFFKSSPFYEKFSLGILEADAFYLMESDLKPEGPVYTERVRFEFKR